MDEPILLAGVKYRTTIEATVLRCSCPDRGVSTHNGQPCPNPIVEPMGVIADSDDDD